MQNTHLYTYSLFIKTLIIINCFKAYFILEVVHNLHVKWTYRTAAISRAAIIVFKCKVYFLPKTVLYSVLVVCLEAGKRFQQLDFLVYQ